ncbi:hypothetical protein Q5741_14995 [Paenibacillus sp. JX-17]|uniref:Uncharacterized protein n=1 Tax=Paenibacillus lacisoli TaxID=3064525 RepID=A0ABT9CEM6_9BACL|nr:hypothetical protein [Paenibacillus sp. JX-17]MDO7907716.1 hypothetical protein [Paenibacillus sp. JX-17]
MNEAVQRYYELKQQQKELEQELNGLRSKIIAHLSEQQAGEIEIDGYRVKVVSQLRKEYDDQKLYHALPDPEMWRLISKADVNKIAGLIRLNILAEDRLADTYAVKTVSLLYVDKQ